MNVKVTNSNGIVSIQIPTDDLINRAGQNPFFEYEVKDKNKFMETFVRELFELDGANHRAVTRITEMVDDTVDKVYESGCKSVVCHDDN